VRPAAPGLATTLTGKGRDQVGEREQEDAAAEAPREGRVKRDPRSGHQQHGAAREQHGSDGSSGHVYGVPIIR
jgi:hypothetical protein